MDPNAAMDNLISTILSGDYDDARDALRDLEGWHRCGGFAPSDPRTSAGT